MTIFNSHYIQAEVILKKATIIVSHYYLLQVTLPQADSLLL